MADPASSPNAESVRLQLDCLDASPVFAQSRRLMTMLRFVAEEALEGRLPIKELTIGSALYGGSAGYDPRIDSTVRVEARRLRRKLEEYYASAVPADAVRIELPVGSYVPNFSWRDDHPEAASAPGKPRPIFGPGAGILVAVVPLHTLSRRPDDEAFADSLTDELIYVLGQAPGLKLISRMLSFGQREQGAPAHAAAQQLQVDVIMQGTVRRLGEHFRITIELSDRQGILAWSDRFDAPPDQVHDLPERIARTVLSRVRVDHSQVRAGVQGVGPTALASNARVFRARQLLDLQTPAALREAQALFEQVAREAPDYARGHSGFADALLDQFRLGLIDRATVTAAGPAVEAALRIDPHSVEALSAQAAWRAWVERDDTAAEASFARALREDPTSRAVRLYGLLLLRRHETQRAQALLQRARAIEPISRQQDTAEVILHFHLRGIGADWPGAQPGPEPNRASAEALYYAGIASVLNLGRAAPAPMWGQDTAEYPDFCQAQIEFDAWAGQPQAALALLQAPPAPISHCALACLAAAVGDWDRCAQALERGALAGEPRSLWAGVDPRFEPLRRNGSLRQLR